MAEQLTAMFEKHGGRHIAYLAEIPGVNTQGKTKEEARANLEDALEVFLEANRELARQDLADDVEMIEEVFAVIETCV